MKDNTIEVTQRLEFLAKQYDVFDCEKDKLKEKTEELTKEGYKEINPIKADKKVLGLIAKDINIHQIPNEEGLSLETAKVDNLKVSICVDVFTDIIKADPTDNKMFVQWMLSIFFNLLKNNDTEHAIRFVTEDLPQANEYLKLFEANKRKQKFIKWAKDNEFRKWGIVNYGMHRLANELKSEWEKLNYNPTDINQYKSLSQLFDAVDPFIERDSTEMSSLLNKFVSLGEAEIPAKDRKFTVYIPKTKEAAAIFEKYAGWCTSKLTQTNFISYTNQKKPNGKDSNLYIIINNKFFEGKSDELYQVHFESGQLHNKSNTSQGVDFYGDVLSKSEVLSNYFYSELLPMVKDCKTGIDNNKYLDYLISFGFSESLFEIFQEDTPAIRIMNENSNTKREIPKLPDLSRFKYIKQLILTDVKLTELHSSVGTLKTLEMLALTNNKLIKLPKEISKLKKLSFLNISGNPIKDIPDELGLLDKTNGGSLNTISFKESDLGVEGVNKIKKLLPSVKLNVVND